MRLCFAPATSRRARKLTTVSRNEILPSQQTKGKHVVFGISTLAIVGIGGYIPVYACQFQNHKASGGA